MIALDNFTGKVLKQIRTVVNVGQVELSKRVEATQGNISYLERYDRPILHVEAYAEALGLTYGELEELVSVVMTMKQYEDRAQEV